MITERDQRNPILHSLSVVCWLLHKLNGYQCGKLPVIILGPKLIAAMSAGMERYKRSRKLGRVRPWQGSREAAACLA